MEKQQDQTRDRRSDMHAGAWQAGKKVRTAEALVRFEACLSPREAHSSVDDD
jgi:hypothetical protein